MFAFSQGKLESLIAPITPYYSSQGEWMGLGGGVLTTYSEIYRRQPAVRSVVDFLAGHLSRMNWKVMQKDGTDDVQLTSHPSQKLLSDPNRWRANSSFWRDFWLDWLIYDRFASVNITDPVDGGIFQMVRIPPVWYTPFGPNYWQPDSLRIIGNRGFGDFPIDQCVYIHGYDPIDPRIGISPMETMRTVLEEEAASQTWRRRFWDGNAQPSMIVTRPLDAPDWSEGAKDRFIESLRNAANRGKPLLLEEGMSTDLNKSQFTPQTSQYIEGKQFTRQEVERFYGLPPGLFEMSGFASTLQYRQFLYSEVLTPYLQRAADELTSQLLTNWWPNPRDKGVRVAAAIEEAVRGSLSEQLSVLGPAVGVPFISREEARAFVNLPLEEKDLEKIAVPLNYVIEGSSGPPGALGSLPSGDSAPGNSASGAGGAGGAPDNPATAQQGNNVGDNGKPESGPVPAPGKSRSQSLAKSSHGDHAAFLIRERDQFISQTSDIVAKSLARQERSVKSRKAGFDRARWDSELADDLMQVSMDTATYFGKDAADRIGGSYDEDRTHSYLQRNTQIAAAQFNSVTAGKIDASSQTAFSETRAEVFAKNRVNSLLNWSIAEAVRQNTDVGGS